MKSRLVPDEYEMVGPNGLEPSTSSVSRMRSNQTELRAYMDGCGFNSTGGWAIRATLVGGDGRRRLVGAACYSQRSGGAEKNFDPETRTSTS